MNQFSSSILWLESGFSAPTTLPGWKVFVPSAHLPGAGEKSSAIYRPIGGQLVKNYELQNKLIAELYRYASLEDGWDNGDGIKPSSAQVSVAQNLIIEMVDSLKPSPMLNSDGNIGLYWNNANFYAEIEFQNDEQVSIYRRGKAAPFGEEYRENESSAEIRPEYISGFVCHSS